MIVWVNGAFGSGKTTLVEELHRRWPAALVYDPEPPARRRSTQKGAAGRKLCRYLRCLAVTIGQGLQNKVTDLIVIPDALGSDIPVYADAWVDGQGRVVRTRIPSYGAGANGSATMTLSDFGKPVKAVAPPVGEVVPLTSATDVLPA
ncbi:hypothetical protein ACIHCQ_35635 [Streptomyces sp. NPDC052236]|uniref:hypothetical protein n=1 Tax=Streptomyces sp. NPDC052236 TaxID=3365686 RepID=UPI0037CE148B